MLASSKAASSSVGSKIERGQFQLVCDRHSVTLETRPVWPSRRSVQCHSTARLQGGLTFVDLVLVDLFLVTRTCFSITTFTAESTLLDSWGILVLCL